MTLDTDKIAAAKLWLISPVPPGAIVESTPLDLPYLAHALYALIAVESGEVRRATCDERWRVYLNPAWLAEASVPEVGKELAHLSWHLLGDHATRARDQDVDSSTAAAWERAADTAISHVLAPEGACPDHLTTAHDWSAHPGLSAEEYFASLSRLPVGGGGGERDGPGGAATLRGTDGCGSGADGLDRTHEIPADSDLGAVSAVDAREIRRAVAIDYQQRPGRPGTEPGEALRWIRGTAEARAPWNALLATAARRAIASAAGRGEYTYARPSRRASSAQGVVLPGQRRPVPRVSVVVDTSSSVDDGLLARALGELDGAIAALGVAGSQVTIYSVDSAVHTVQRVTRSRDAHLVGAGGTDLRVGLKAVELERPRPDVIIVFTDGGTPWPRLPPPGARVIAAILGRARVDLPATPPWAIRVECVLDD